MANAQLSPQLFPQRQHCQQRQQQDGRCELAARSVRAGDRIAVGRILPEDRAAGINAATPVVHTRLSSVAADNRKTPIITIAAPMHAP